MPHLIVEYSANLEHELDLEALFAKVHRQLIGMQLFPTALNSADSFVLLIPAQSGWSTLSVLVFIGGFSAATSMIIISTKDFILVLVHGMVGKMERVFRQLNREEEITLI